jgi:hypothetical protein
VQRWAAGADEPTEQTGGRAAAIARASGGSGWEEYRTGTVIET